MNSTCGVILRMLLSEAMQLRASMKLRQSDSIYRDWSLVPPFVWR